MILRVLHFVPIFPEVSGVSTFAGEIANIQSFLGCEVSIATSSQFVMKHYPVTDSVHVVDMNQGTVWNNKPPDIMHIHGLWTLGLRRVVAKAVKAGMPIVWSPHGMLAPWAMRHKGWKKFPAWWLWQKRDLGKAAAIHCTTEQEVRWCEALGFKNCFVVPLGTRGVLSCTERVGHVKKVLLFVGRLYPVKGLENLIHAWAAIEGRIRTGWTLRLVGPDQAGYRKVLEKLVRRLGLEASVVFAGARLGDDLNREYDDCDCLVLPSFTENFGATIVDALAHGRPCIASTFTPWKELEERGCGWWVSNEPASLAKTLSDMMNAGEERRMEMGRRGRSLVEEKYTWPAIAQRMKEKYESLL